jgi:ABC-type dipeptide/oligopeptide/nickel transport system permease component
MRRSDYLLKRTLQALVTCFVAVTFNFLLFRALPGSVVSNLSRVPNATPALKEALTREFGLDHSLWSQYGSYLVQLTHVNLGVSYQNSRPVIDNLIADLGNTIPMVTLGTLISIVLGIVTGAVAAWRRGTQLENWAVAPALAFYAMPAQWLGMMFIVLFSAYLPTGGMVDNFLINPTPVQHIEDLLRHMILPSLTLGLVLYGQYTLIVRSSMLETLSEDYILTAKAVGFSKPRILARYAFRNAMLPVVSVVALSLGFIVGGAILVETVFNWPGIGLAVYQAVLYRDYPMLQGAFLVLTLSVIFFNLVADLLYFRLDPRIR